MTVVRLENVGKKFKLYRSPSEKLKEIFLKKDYHREFWALKDISFTLKRGEIIGVIGENGSGKSTLLKLIAGVLIPDFGNIYINGRVTGLLELGTGFNFEFSGRENIYFNGTFLGLSKDEIKKIEQKVIEFSELEDFIDEPLKTYSSGMIMRLGFSIAINANPDCFLIDEALAVGDIYFQQKCFQKIKEFKEKGGSILFTSHDLNAIKLLSDKVVLLDKGKILFIGSPEEAVNLYNELLSEKAVELDIKGKKKDYGNKKAVIDSIRLLDEKEREIEKIPCGKSVKIEITAVAKEDLEDVTCGFLFRNAFGLDVFGTNTFFLKRDITIKRGEKKKIVFHFPKFSLSPGLYSLTVALHKGKDHLSECYHWIDRAKAIEVVHSDETPFSGICKLDVKVCC